MRGFRHWRWHLAEMYVKVNGEKRFLWREVDEEHVFARSGPKLCSARK